MTPVPPRLSALGITKSFAGIPALEGVSFSVRPGSIHAVLGENGAGKSTLMKIVAGALPKDGGTLSLDGAPFAPDGPASARRDGVAIVHQELSICPHMTVAENVLLGSEPSRFGWVDAREQSARVQKALAPLERARRSLPLDAQLSSLSPAEQQLVEIARALAAERTRLLILDEPTSSLSSDDVERLFQALRELRQQGLAILYISHFLEEVRTIADEYTVLRDGRSVESGLVRETTNDALVTAMAGRAVPARVRGSRAAGDVVLALTGVAGSRLPIRADLELRRGEVLGIAGLVGSGRTELLRAIFGLEAVRRGEVRVKGLSGANRPGERLRQGLGLLSEDRKREGLALDLTIAENVTLSKLGPLGRFGFVSPRRERKVAAEWIGRLGIRARGAEQRVADLSGGNQQKVALARLLYHDVDVLLLDEPTRGIDVRSRSDVHRWIDVLCGEGKAILLVSSQLLELLAVCDRVAVMHRGQLGPARPVDGLTEHDLLTEAAGA